VADVSPVRERVSEGGLVTRYGRLLSSLGLILAIASAGALALAARGSLGVPTGTGGARASAQDSGITVEFLGWSHYRLTSPSGKVVVTNPYITNNPDAAITLDEGLARRTNIILVADGHGDEVGDSVELAKGTGAMLITPSGELRSWMETKGVPQSQLGQVNPGSFFKQDGITLQVVHAIHSSGARTPGEPLYYGGVAGSYMITFENGYTVYFSGSSAATMDMQMWADLYKPDMAIVHISGNHEPRDAAMIAKFMTNNNPNLKTVFPHHHRLQPQPGGVRPSDLRAAMEQMGLRLQFIEPDPLRPYVLTK
jgi:L-ascorbate metabolism protein UlaG (beta-lactamase superfamily)